jgi:hypothetical protein
MRKFSILVIGHQLKNKVVAKFGDVVDESQLLGNADELVKAGFVEEVKGEVKEDDSFDLDKLTKEELIDFAKANGYEVSEKLSKKVILSEIDAQIKEQEVKGEVIVKE